MAKYAHISNGSYVNQYDGEVRVTVGTVGTTSADVQLYSTVFTVKSGNLTISLDPVLGKMKAVNDIINQRGFLGGSTSGEVQLAPKTTSITLKTDYVFLTADKKGIEMSSNILEAMIKGEGFISNGGYRKVVGTNGTVKKGFNTNQNRFIGKLFELDGRLIISDAATDDGDAITVKNIRIPAYNKQCNFIIFEVLSKFDDDTVDGLRLVYTMNGEVNWADATDANEVSFTQTQLCDVRFIKNFLIEGYEEAEVGADIPARRVLFAKNPVSMFKGVASVTAGAVDGITGGNTLEANTSFEVPNKVVVVDLTTGDSESVVYVPKVKDVASIYVPKTTATDPGYVLAVCDVAPTWDDTTGATDSTIDAISAPSTITVLGKITDVDTGDLIRITVGTGEYEYYRVATLTASTDTTIVVEGTLSGKVAAGQLVERIDAEATFAIIKNDITLTEKAVYRDVAGNTATNLASGLVGFYDYNFEEITFYKIEE